MGKYRFRKYRRYEEDSYTKIIGVVKTPLSFFVLSLLIIEGFLGAIIILGNVSPLVKGILILIGILTFIGESVAVFMLAWFKPGHLTAGSTTDEIEVE